MISRDSKSYPYLAIAQHYNVLYAKVLAYSDRLANDVLGVDPRPPATQWRYSVWRLEKDKTK